MTSTPTEDPIDAPSPDPVHTRRLCRGRAKKRNVIHFTKHVFVPFSGFGQEFGSYTADIDWTIRFVARHKLA